MKYVCAICDKIVDRFRRYNLLEDDLTCGMINYHIIYHYNITGDSLCDDCALNMLEECNRKLNFPYRVVK